MSGKAIHRTKRHFGSYIGFKSCGNYPIWGSGSWCLTQARKACSPALSYLELKRTLLLMKQLSSFSLSPSNTLWQTSSDRPRVILSLFHTSFFILIMQGGCLLHRTLKIRKGKKNATHPRKSASYIPQLFVLHQINKGSFSFILVLAPNFRSQNPGENLTQHFLLWKQSINILMVSLVSPIN